MLTKIIESYAFNKVPISYDNTLPDLFFVERTDYGWSTIKKYKIPVRYCKINNSPNTLLFCHGNGEDIGRFNIYEFSRLLNINVVIFDYAGYGLHSKKTPSEEDCYQDSWAVYRHLVDELNIPNECIVIYGFSLGTGVACELAETLCQSNTPPAGLVLLAPFLSAVKVVTDWWTPTDIFMSYKRAPKIICPVTIIHGTQDTVIHVSHAEKLAPLFPNLKNLSIIEGGTHINILAMNIHYKLVKTFLAEILKSYNDSYFIKVTDSY